MAKDVLTLAWSEMRRRKFASAIKLLESKAELYEDNFEFYLATGIACLYAGDIGSASSYFQRARHISLTDTRLLLGQAAIFMRRGDVDRALQYYFEIKENEPENKIAAQAMEFIRTHGDYDTICRWVDTGKIEQFYPPLGVNPNKVWAFIIPIFACILGVVVAIKIIPGPGTFDGPRANLANLELSADEKTSAKESDLTTQSYKFILTNKEITKRYSNALQYFQEHRDNAAQIEINTILNSDATLSIKQKAQILAGYLEIPDFDSIKDIPSYSDVKAQTFLYQDCWVAWGGKVSNAVTYEDGSYSCELLVGDETLAHYEGNVPVRFTAVPMVEGSKPVKILGQVAIQDGELLIKGRAVYQSVH
ncbi:MAG: hypothetical protein MR958_03200 [Spirochaetia bacterium]|nr:hypothetical protein [Spirochaetia bacterium]MDD7268475.1 hypothetical protein [Treponema sp.]MDY4985928.1 hypothetical protein [Treponema sp.]